jgi:L-glyceraldehyde 3-phosphate reductase
LDQSLKRLGLPYVDIFYHHRPDPDTPMEESLTAVADAVRSGRALYAGISNYNAAQTRQAAAILKKPRRAAPDSPAEIQSVQPLGGAGAAAALTEVGAGCIPFSPLAQGLLTNRYLAGLPTDSRAVKSGVFLKPGQITAAVLTKIQALNEVATARGATLAQLATVWLLRRPEITSVLIGASKVAQIDDIHAGLSQPPLATAELAKIEAILGPG